MHSLQGGSFAENEHDQRSRTVHTPCNGKLADAEEDDLFQHLPSQAICFDLFTYPVSEIVETLCVSEMPELLA